MATIIITTIENGKFLNEKAPDNVRGFFMGLFLQ
jgi:hypothetical protein